MQYFKDWRQYFGTSIAFKLHNLSLRRPLSMQMFFAFVVHFGPGNKKSQQNFAFIVKPFLVTSREFRHLMRETAIEKIL